MFEDITAESIAADILGAMPDIIDKREGSYTSEMIAPISTELWKAYTAMNALLPIAFVDETSGEYIDKRCSEIDMYRKAGTKAAVTLTLTGTDGTKVPAGTCFLTSDGLEFSTDADAVISSGQASVSATAQEVGETYNVEAGTITVQYNSLAGLSAVTNSKAAQGGTDAESDASLVARYYAALQKKATSGNVNDYEQWALEVDGVGGVKVIPLMNGAGTVGILIAGPAKQPVDAAVVSACTAHIEDNRPIGASVTVQSAEGLSISVTVTATLDASTTADTVKSSLSEKLQNYMESIVDDYFKNNEFKTYTLLYNRVAYFLLGIDGVEDYTDLKVNGGTENITIAANQVPVLGTVTVT